MVATTLACMLSKVTWSTFGEYAIEEQKKGIPRIAFVDPSIGSKIRVNSGLPPFGYIWSPNSSDIIRAQ